MTIPPRAQPADGPAGYTYAVVLVRLDEPARTPDDVLADLREIRFSGWVAPPEDGWLVVVPLSGAGTVATGRRGVVGLGEWLADRRGSTVLAARVVDDRQLLLVAWADGEEIGRYLSDPSHGTDPDEEILSEPFGTEYAEGFAAACGHPDAGEELGELLAEELDPDSVIESERLGRVLRLLEMPRWPVAVASLPRNMPTGPRVREMTRLRTGVPGPWGWLRGRVVEPVRRRRPPPPAVTDAPRGQGGGMDPWLM